ncbi:GHKL domain-containing protein [uncultured Pseudoflavonifractor sp.]|uniref:GHKL domain-containing protein n=1 Tax=uncultured Pseudoflavonifractor sp. TaxID=1221379 RepID=UPI0025DD67C2|nr:GHKL domain-containing protein [uncultured Pseudoflavonifractor sp.]
MLILNFILRWQIEVGMLGAACLFVPWNRRRPCFLLRIALGVVLMFAISCLESAVTDGTWTSTLPAYVISLLLDTALLVLLIWQSFECSPIHAVFSATCAYAVQHIASKLAYMGAMPLICRGMLKSWHILLFLLLANALVCVPIFLGFTRRFFKEGQLMFDRRKTVIYSGLFLFVAVYLSSLLENNLDAAAPTYLTSYLALNAFCVLFGVAVLSMEFSNCSIKRLESENMILEQMLENDRQQYELAKQEMEKINIRYHDLKQQYSRAPDEERARLEQEMEAIRLRYYTGNKALDIVLTQKSGLCEQAGIQLVCSVDGSCLSGMTHYHIYSMLGNAIDNAMECLAKVEDREKKVINLSICRRADMAVICVENYTPAPPVVRDGALVTTKQDAGSHGYGTKSIKNIAELYGGTADYFVEDEVFCLLITIPCAGTAARSDRAAG